LRREFQRAVAAWIADLFWQRPAVRHGRAYWSISPALAPPRRSTGGIPIGSVLVLDGQIIGRGHNQRVQQGSVIHHAEMNCLENAGRQKASVYQRCVLYSTLSPCPMCSGAILLYKIPRVVVGETFGHHDLRDVFGPAFDVGSVAKNGADQAPGDGLDFIGVLGLHIVPGQRFVNSTNEVGVDLMRGLLELSRPSTDRAMRLYTEEQVRINADFRRDREAAGKK